MQLVSRVNLSSILPYYVSHEISVILIYIIFNADKSVTFLHLKLLLDKTMIEVLPLAHMFSVFFCLTFVYLADDEVTAETCLLRAIGVKCMTTESFTIIYYKYLSDLINTTTLKVFTVTCYTLTNHNTGSLSHASYFNIKMFY